MPEVDLEAAFVWNCPNCNNENFERSIPMEITEEQKSRIRKKLGDIYSLDPGDVTKCPNEVICRNCANIYIPKKGHIDILF